MLTGFLCFGSSARGLSGGRKRKIMWVLQTEERERERDTERERQRDREKEKLTQRHNKKL